MGEKNSLTFDLATKQKPSYSDFKVLILMNSSPGGSLIIF